jgi:hypothetical protein
MNSILYLREIGNDFYRINEYIIIFFYIYGIVRESSYLTEIIAEVHVVDIFKLKILIAINTVNIKKIFINFRIRTLFINFLMNFNRFLKTRIGFSPLLRI